MCEIPQLVQEYLEQNPGLTNPRLVTTEVVHISRWLATEPDGSQHIIPEEAYLALSPELKRSFEARLNAASKEVQWDYNPDQADQYLTYLTNQVERTDYAS